MFASITIVVSRNVYMSIKANCIVKSNPETRSVLLACHMLLAWLFPGLVQAAQSSESITYERRIEAVTSTPQSRQKAIAEGKNAAFFCVNCHGETGLGRFDNVPNLAGQNPAYLMVQIQKFADGRRKDDFMSGLIKALSEADRLNMAVYYASLTAPANTPKDKRAADRGRTHYSRACVGCHGADAHGNRDIARLAGQKASYVMESLQKYRDRRGARTDPVMSSVASGLNNAQIEDLSAYLSSLP